MIYVVRLFVKISTVNASSCKVRTTVPHSIWHFRSKNRYAIFNVMNIIWTRYSRIPAAFYRSAFCCSLAPGADSCALGTRIFLLLRSANRSLPLNGAKFRQFSNYRMWASTYIYLCQCTNLMKSCSFLFYLNLLLGLANTNFRPT